MDQIPIEGKDPPHVPVDETIEEPKRAQEQEQGFMFRLPGNLDQSMSLLNSMLKEGNPQGMLDQLMRGAKPQASEGHNAYPQQPAFAPGTDANNNQPQRPAQIDLSSKMLEQSLGMIGSMFKGQENNAAMGMLSSFFGQPKKQEPQQPQVYPTLDDQKPAGDAKKPQSPLNFESMLSQGVDKISLALKEDVVGKFLGKQNQPEPADLQPQPSLYPKLDDLVEDKPKPKPAESGQGGQINLENVLNQGIDAINAALKGNAGNIFGQFIKVQPNDPTSKTSTSDRPTQNQPSANVRDDIQPAPFAVVPDPFETKPEPAKPKEIEKPKQVEKPKEEEKPKEAEKTKTTSADGKKDDVIDFIPDEAFEEAFDGMAGLK